MSITISIVMYIYIFVLVSHMIQYRFDVFARSKIKMISDLNILYEIIIKSPYIRTLTLHLRT